MNEDLAAAFAARFKLPVDEVRRLNAEVAERCALIANRYEPAGSFSFEQLSAVETLGAEIGSAIMAQFPEPAPRPMTAREAGWAPNLTPPVSNG